MMQQVWLSKPGESQRGIRGQGQFDHHYFRITRKGNEVIKLEVEMEWDALNQTFTRIPW